MEGGVGGWGPFYLWSPGRASPIMSAFEWSFLGMRGRKVAYPEKLITEKQKIYRP